jgi:hypothetical protein
MTTSKPTAAESYEEAVYVNGVYISGSLLAEGRGVAALLDGQERFNSSAVVRALVSKLEAIRDAA